MSDALIEIKWGTPMPVALQVAGTIGSVRAFGTCRARVTGQARYEEHERDPGAVLRLSRPVLAAAATTALGEMARQAADWPRLTDATSDIAALARAAAEPGLAALGLSIDRIDIEAIQRT